MPARTSEPITASTTTAIASRGHHSVKSDPASSVANQTATAVPTRPTASQNQNSGAASHGPPCGKNWRSISRR
ncbi:hypothetical protein OU787_03815 [Kitasatospora sp. YST-16]|uniref:hypothetical protein n=1 Tax=Kitasatospora sp. YST-16 TaxID=2998080 RepID=UPI002284B8F3|nr:hypothetical protein [Kitasatospora sp. YST-16]WAL70697.1 hypothetical protein OU787_03815 [Kitasatospora sp. YST-16]